MITHDHIDHFRQTNLPQFDVDPKVGFGREGGIHTFND